ncbi:ras-related protein Rab-32B-like [Mizuhopecten yessoensis]|uniref:Ras-related protein Rab n=1 Tax=Mizuhopecten yessoensis TaxID=6573 RepID=A0A210Q3Q4_MIZYE|nr:ras-related protein Rab-32B-like [Mizuhopecten yessoensis]OWF43373.1 Ras-related protein Rab-32B [Mizuhopecten yessoensis]
MAASTPGNNQEHLYKILVIGEFGVGKTSIIRRYTEGTFSPNYKLTIGVDFALKSMVWDDNTKVNMQLWDIAGHERFGHMTRVYYKYAIGAIIVFDLSRPATFDSVLKWLNDVNSKVMLANEQPVPVLLLANKCDIEGAEPDTSKIDKFCKEHQFIGWFPTSAKSDTNVSEAVRFLVKHILELPSESQQPTEHISLATENNTSHYDDSFETEEGYNKRNNKQSGCCS